MRKYDDISARQLIDAIETFGGKRAAARSLHIPWSSFCKLWKEKARDYEEWSKYTITTYKIGIISDMHYGSKYCDEESLNSFIEYCYDSGITKILCCGDISDGIKMRKGHESEIFLHGIDEITEYIAEHLPQYDELEYYSITGNHDNSLVKLSGVDLGFQLAKERSDFHYLGYTRSDLILDGNVKVRLYHGAGSCTANRSTRLQKKVSQVHEEYINSRTKPCDVFLAGHCHHNAVLFNYLGMTAISLGCFQTQTPFLQEKGLVPDISGIILEYQSDGQTIIKTPKIEYVKYN